jgi:hypothetical protein
MLRGFARTEIQQVIQLLPGGLSGGRPKGGGCPGGMGTSSGAIDGVLVIASSQLCISDLVVQLDTEHPLEFLNPHVGAEQIWQFQLSLNVSYN